MNILQLICPIGFYGAERWVLALANNIDHGVVKCNLVVTSEDQSKEIELANCYPPESGTVFRVEMKNRFDLGVLKQLCEIIRSNDIHIVHTHGYKSDILGVLAARKTRIKSVCTPHGFGEKIDLKLKIFIKIGGFFLRFFDKVAPLSEQLRDEVLALGVKPSRVCYIANGVDLSDIDKIAGNNPDVKPDGLAGKHIGFVGQMIPRKEIQEMLTVFDRLWADDNELVLSLIGDGKDRVEMEKFASGLDSANNIKFLGFRSDRIELMQSFSLFLMTSSSEGIPRCLMEAMALKLPVVAYNIPGVDQLVLDQETGLLAEAGNTDQLVNNCKRILSDESLAIDLGLRGREYVEQNYSAARMAADYVKLFDDVMRP